MNKKGFTFIEMVVVIIIIAVACASSIGNFFNFLSNPDDAVDNIESKITYEVQLGKNTPFKSGYIVNGTTNIMPYVKFYKDSMAYSVLKENTHNEIKIEEVKYIKYGDNKYAVSTDIPDDTLFFKANGLIVDKNGNEIKQCTITIKNIDTEKIVKKITVNTFGFFNEV